MNQVIRAPPRIARAATSSWTLPPTSTDLQHGLDRHAHAVVLRHDLLSPRGVPRPRALAAAHRRQAGLRRHGGQGDRRLRRNLPDGGPDREDERSRQAAFADQRRWALVFYALSLSRKSGPPRAPVRPAPASRPRRQP